MRDNRLFIDVDSNSKWMWRTGPIWDNLLPLVRMEAIRLGAMYPLGNKAVILRSDDGWFIKFPRARLKKEEELAIMWNSMGHFGHIYFSQEIGDTTLRASSKPDRWSHPPYVVEVIRLTSKKYCPKCGADVLGVDGRHETCCWCGTRLEEEKDG